MEKEEIQLNVAISPETDELLRLYVFKSREKKKTIVEEAIIQFISGRNTNE